MPSPASILCFGHDFTLVQTRQQIFRHADFISQIADSRQQLHRYFAEYAVDVLVVCHSVTPEDCEDARQTAHNQKDSTLVLVLEKGTQTCNADGKDAVFQTSRGPQSFLLAVTRLLKEHGQQTQEARYKKHLPALLLEGVRSGSNSRVSWAPSS